jgi:ubiquinone biosynthesis protein
MLLSLFWAGVSEYVSYLCWHRNFDTFVRNCCARTVQINVVFAKAFQALVVKYAPDSVSVTHNICPDPFPKPPRVENVVFEKVIGSGVVSVVYAATWYDKNVVVKVKRTGIQEEIRVGLLQLQQLYAWLHLVPCLKKFDLPLVHREVESLLLEQTDFAAEVANQEKYRGLFSYNPMIVVPEVYLQTDDYIVMERLYSVPRDPALNDHYAQQLCKVIIKGAVLDGFVHADLHTGNVLLLADKKLGIIDFGLMVTLSIDEQNNYLALCTAINATDYAEAARISLERYCTARTEQTNPERAREVLEDIYRRSDQISQKLGVSEINDMVNGIYPCGYAMAPSFYKIIMSMAACDALLNSFSASAHMVLKEEIRKLL